MSTVASVVAASHLPACVMMAFTPLPGLRSSRCSLDPRYAPRPSPLCLPISSGTGDLKSLTAKPNFLARSESVGSFAHESNRRLATRLQLQREEILILQ